MSDTLRQYDPKKVTASWGIPGAGLDLLADAVAGTFLEVSAASDAWSDPRVDRQGNAVRVFLNNGSGLLTIRNTAEGPMNAVLSALAQTDKLAQNIVGSITVKDLNGSTVCVYTGCYIKRIPPPSFGMEAGERIWRWSFVGATEFIGGQNVA
jgi:hypothetical protein